MASIPQQRPSPLAELLDRVTRERLEAFIAAAVDLLDLADGEADIEANGDELDGSTAEDDFYPHYAPGPGDPTDAEPDDEDETAYPEWTNLPGSTKRAGHITTDLLSAVPCNHEDAEDEDPDTSVEDSPEGFDPEEDYCTAGDDGVFSGNTFWGIESKYFCVDNPGSEDDAETEQMLDDVPTLKVFSAHENIFTDQRQFLGYSNLMTSFRGDGRVVVSADSGKRLPHSPMGDEPKTAGAPV